MAWVGMNIAKCKHHSEELERQRVKLDKLLHLIDGEASKIRGNWNGSDAQRFQSDWQGKHKHNAVSYTHLDVYKRQLPRRPSSIPPSRDEL